MSGPGAVEGIEDVTPEWLSAALSRPDRPVSVTGVVAERVGTGQIGATYRLTIRAAEPPAGVPERLVVKLSAADPATQASVADGYRKEVGFYRLLAPTLAVRVPACWYGAVSDDGSVCTLLLDDLAPAEPGTQAAGCSPEQAAAAVRNVAGLHAPRWNDAGLESHDFLGHLDQGVADFLGALHVDATETFTQRYGEQLDAEDVATLRASAAATAAWLMTRPEPFSLTHGDYRLDNLMFHPTDGTVTAVDWQTVSIGPPARDVAYLLGTSLAVAARRAHEQELVRLYGDELASRGVRGYDAARCYEDYRLGQLQGPLITVMGSEYATAVRTPAADEMFLAMAARSCTAVRDLGSLDLVG